jgi:hypothetical protein
MSLASLDLDAEVVKTVMLQTGQRLASLGRPEATDTG